MRWSASAIAACALAACGNTQATAPAPATPASATPASVSPAPARRACAAIAPACDGRIEDAAALALVGARCGACHGPHGAAGHDFTELAALRAAPVASMLGDCEMPPPPLVLSDADRALLLAWATCPQKP